MKDPYEANIMALTNVAEERGAVIPRKSDRKFARDDETAPEAALVPNARDEQLPLPLLLPEV